MSEPPSETVRTRSIYKGRVVDLHVDSVRLPNGRETDLEIVRHVGAAAVVPIDQDGRVILIRQFRHATGGFIVEIPAGKLDGGEAPEACAARELIEETGRRAERLVPMGWIWTTPGFSDERIWLFAGLDLQPAPQGLEADEVLTLERHSRADAVAMAIRGEIRDAKSVTALLRLEHYVP